MSASFGQVPPVHLVLPVHWRFRLVCPVSSQALLLEAVWAVRLDPHRTFGCSNAKLSNYKKSHSRNHLVNRPLLDG